MDLLRHFQIFLILAEFILINCKTHYCSRSLCHDKQRHVACHFSGHFGPKCPKNARIVKLSQRDIKQILHEHNRLRNKIANGEESGFESASRMTTMVKSG